METEVKVEKVRGEGSPGRPTGARRHGGAWTVRGCRKDDDVQQQRGIWRRPQLGGGSWRAARRQLDLGGGTAVRGGRAATGRPGRAHGGGEIWGVGTTAVAGFDP